MMATLLDATSVSGPALSATSVSVPAVAAPRNASFGAFVGLRPSSIGSGGVAAAVVSRRTASGFSGRAAALEPQREGARRFGGGNGGVRESLARARGSSTVAEQAGPTAPAAAPSKQKIRIKLRSYWVHLIQQACQQILEAAKNTNAKTMGPVPLPTNRRLYCVLRSPHVDKDSREHFEIRTHMRLIDLANPNAQTIDALMQLDLPAGVDVEVKLS